MVDWKVPLLHMIETRLTAPPTREQWNRIKSLGVEIKKGAFSKQESDLVMENFKEFCKRHDLPPNPAPFLKFNRVGSRLMSSEQRIHFGQYLARGLDNRLLSTVYRHFQNKASPKRNTGKFVSVHRVQSR